MEFRARRVLRFGHAILVAASLAVAQGRAQPQRPEVETRTIKPRRLEPVSVDAGDSYSSPSGKRRLLRMAGAVVVRLQNNTEKAARLAALTRAGSPLEGCVVDCEPGRGYTVLKAAARARRTGLSETNKLAEFVTAARRSEGVRSADPVFISPASKLWLVPTAEIILRLQAETDARVYFGADWPRARPLAGCRDQFVLALPAATAEEMLAEVNRRAADPRVVWVEPNFLSQVIKQTTDPYYNLQWSLNNTGQAGGKSNADVNGPEAWKITTGNRDVVIALIDDGTQTTHPDLRANIFSNPDETQNGLDDDGNGYVDDLRGWDFIDHDSDPSPADPDDDHGTLTAGVAVATANNSQGLAGIAYRCRLMPIKVIRGTEGATSAELAEAIYYAAGSTRDGQSRWRGADVISISLSFEPSLALNDALSWAASRGRDDKGCAIFAASGNEASRWLPTRVKLAVGQALGPGSYQFGFEYCKDGSVAEGEDLIKIDNVALLSGDGVRIVDSTLGPGGRQDFEGSFPPRDWFSVVSDNGGDRWSVTTNRSLTGTGGSRSARSGSIPDGSWTQLITPYVNLSGNEYLSFSCYTSCEGPSLGGVGDGLYVWVYDRTPQIVYRFRGPSGTPLVSGNSPVFTTLAYPASHADTIAVGASTDTDRRADYSTYGDKLDFVVPSSGGWSDIISTDRTGANGFTDGLGHPSADYYLDFGGTSAAAPLAAGVGALMLSANSNLTAHGVRLFLQNSCTKIGGVTYTDGRNPFYGYGRIHAQRAVSNALPNLVVRLFDLPDPVTVGSNLLYTVTVSNVGAFVAWYAVLTNSLLAPDAIVVAEPAPSLVLPGNKRVFDLGDLEPGRGTKITLWVTPPATGWITNTCVAASVTRDYNPADNLAKATTRVSGRDTNRPALAFLAPTNHAVVTQATVTVRGIAKDNAGVAAIQYRLENLAGIGDWQTISNQTLAGALNWSAPFTDLFPGTNVVRARAWDVSGNVSAEATRSLFFAARSQLTVGIEGRGFISPNWTNRALAVHRAYTLAASPALGYVFSNWLGSVPGQGGWRVLAQTARLNFFMESNLTLRANFVSNPFLAVRGNYSGLFCRNDVLQHESSGFFTLSLAGLGAYSAHLRTGGRRLGLAGQFGLEGRATNLVLTPGGTNDLTVEWRLDWGANSTAQINGRVLSALGVADLLGDRAPVYRGANLSPYRGRYTFIIPGAGEAGGTHRPGGDGFGAVTVASNGLLNLSGTLADGTAIKQTVPVSTNGIWPLYVSLYSGKGSVLSRVAFDTNAPPTASLTSDRVTWIKPAVTNPGPYPGGFALETNLLGSTYTRAHPVLAMMTGEVVFAGSNLNPAFTNLVILGVNNRVTNGSANPLTLTINATNGLFSGTVTLPSGAALAPPGTNRTLPFRGVILQRQGNGSGHFLGTDQSGQVLVRPAGT
jgi:subtilisin family serine protease